MVMILNARASDHDEIKPLIDLCKAGRLFDVQEWIASGKPVNPPPPPDKGARRKCPLEVSIGMGFHSLVQILLEGGAKIIDGHYNALLQAVQTRRLDLITLLVDHGADVNSVNMAWVFEEWDPSIMEYFIEHGADVETGHPLAAALCWKIRTALGVFKRHKNRFPSFQEQANIALRHHCREGDLKWVSLMLWAGADPFAKGLDSYDVELDPDDDDVMCALEYAALYKHFEILKLKQIKISPEHPIVGELLRNACRADSADFLKDLIKRGFKPVDQKDQGSSLIQTCLGCLRFSFDLDRFMRGERKNIDCSHSRETLKMIHILAKHGAKWLPSDRSYINDARSSLLKMSPDYTVEFVWIMSKYKASCRENIEQLLKTPAIRKHIAQYQPRIDELLKG